MSTTSPDAESPAVGDTRADLAVTGMHCGSCAALIEETLSRQPGITSVTVDLDGAKAAVTFDPGTIALDEVCSIVTGLGYTAEPATGSAPDLT